MADVRAVTIELLKANVEKYGDSYIKRVLADDPAQLAFGLIKESSDLEQADADEVTFRRIVNAVTDYQIANRE